MKRFPILERKFRQRDENSIELAIPFKLLPALGFSKVGFETKPKKRALNSQGENAALLMWINNEDNIELRDSLKSLQTVVGVFFERPVRVHGGSCVFTVHFSVIESLRRRKIILDRVRVFINKKGNLELNPITSKS